MYCAKNISDNIFVIVLTKEAQLDLDEIFIWYEEQKKGLGFDFINYFEATLHKLALNPYYASFILDDARGASLKKFPYEVAYRINEIKQQIRVIAIIHNHRNPEWLKKEAANYIGLSQRHLEELSLFNIPIMFLF